MSAHCNTFLDDSEAEDDDIGTNSNLSSDVPDSPGSLKDFIEDSASNESSFAISEQHSPSTGDEGESSTSRSPQRSDRPPMLDISTGYLQTYIKHLSCFRSRWGSWKS
ncbi:hypothetical protein PG994_015292 [Apiospora phragmitis]|uniref:Uncharacterized protein n=1 Tax=Apiospora phragmitis TaxID=2905665 RepID=A0ABR1SR44_9PEZI